jgi:hypothetical protein
MGKTMTNNYTIVEYRIIYVFNKEIREDSYNKFCNRDISIHFHNDTRL